MRAFTDQRQYANYNGPGRRGWVGLVSYMSANSASTTYVMSMHIHHRVVFLYRPLYLANAVIVNLI